MSEKNINARIIHKHDVESNWNLAINFIPKKGEIVLYDPDSTYSYSRVKIGDGVRTVINLPFSPELSEYATKNFVNSQLTSKVDKVEGKGLSTNDYTTEEKNKLASIICTENEIQTIWDEVMA